MPKRFLFICTFVKETYMWFSTHLNTLLYLRRVITKYQFTLEHTHTHTLKCVRYLNLIKIIFIEALVVGLLWTISIMKQLLMGFICFVPLWGCVVVASMYTMYKYIYLQYLSIWYVHWIRYRHYLRRVAHGGRFKYGVDNCIRNAN